MNYYKTLVEGINTASQLYQNCHALRLQDKVFTYDELFKQAKEHAMLLLASMDKPAIDKIGIFCHRSAVGYIGTLSALMTGAAFIPLHPKFPEERNITILKQCQPEVIITDVQSVDRLVTLLEKMQWSNLVLLVGGKEEHYADTRLNFIDTRKTQHYPVRNLPIVSPDDDAYILFTSGSTGQPKGVPITHKNVCSFLHYNQSRYNVSHTDKLSQTFEQTFDLSIFDLFMAWCHGACVCAMQPIDLLSPSKYINENEITIWFSVPSVISLLQKQGFLQAACFPGLRLSLFCGEPLLEEQMALWAKAAPNAICENLYGPTELTIACSAYRWKRQATNIVHNGIVSIGKIYEHLEFILLDEQHNQQALEGELCVAGDQRFWGYLQPAQHSCFVVIEDHESTQKKIFYKTGDRIRIDSSGEIVYLGRIDQQVKLNGYRVELGEIESALSQTEGVEQVFLFCLQDKGALSKKLVAYVVGNTCVEKIMETAKRLLPTYMLPSQIKIADSFPLNSNGKIDRKAIQEQFLINQSMTQDRTVPELA